MSQEQPTFFGQHQGAESPVLTQAGGRLAEQKKQPVRSAEIGGT